MSISKDKNHRMLICLLYGFFFVSLAVLFGKVIVSGKALLASDAGVFSFQLEHIIFPSSIAGAWEPFDLGTLWPPENILPRRFLSPVLEPANFILWSYILDTVFISLATFILLRTLQISALVSAIGSISMALSTHTLTLISAGHLSKTGMMPFAILTFASLYRAIDKNSLFWFACSGVIAGMAVSEHYDVGYMFSVLAAVYGLALIVRASGHFSMKPNYLKLALGILLAGTLALMSFLPQLQFITSYLAPGRNAVVENAKIPDSNEQWKFATSWSLPPEDIIEFIIPGIYGLETGNQKAPYWGRTGQARGRDDHNIQMALRQHGVYLGIIQIIFGLFAVSVLLTSGTTSANKHPDSGDCDIQQLGMLRFNAKFWAIAWAVCVILALGHYGPLYWFFFKFFPYGAQIRCPIKFMHLVELATSVLFSIGLQQLVTTVSGSFQHSDKTALLNTLKRITSISLSVLSIIFIGFLLTFLSTNNLNIYWTRIGMQSLTTQLMDQMLGAEIHAIIIAGLLIGLFFFIRHNCQKNIVKWIVPLAVTLLITVDMTIVASPYIKVDNNYNFFYSRNPLIEHLLSRGDRYRVTPLSGNILYQIQYQSFRFFGINNTFPPQGSSIEPEMKEFMQSVGNNYPRFWQLTSTGYLLAARDILPQLSSLKGIMPEFWFSIIQGKDKSLQLNQGPENTSPFVLLRNQTALPRSSVFYNWEDADRKAILAQIGSSSWDPAKTLLVEATDRISHIDSNNLIEAKSAVIVKYEPCRVEIQAQASREAILLLNDRYDSHWHGFVNGKEYPVLRCNGIMRGVRIPAGNNTVVFAFSPPYKQAAIIKVCAVLFLFAWIVIIAARNLWTRVKGLSHN